VSLGSPQKAPFTEAEFRSHFDYLRAYALSLSRNRARADDMVQDALLAAWRHRDQFEPGTNLRAWLSRILRNTFYSSCRKQARAVEDLDDKLMLAMPQQPSQEYAIGLRQLGSAIAALPASQRDALALIGVDGLAYEEAAIRLDCPVGSIKSRVSRARQALAGLHA
jgi:RNA polymerase sigma-70 factor, ECF subfamily